MQLYLLAPLLLNSMLPLKADETCLFISQFEPGLKIEVGTKGISHTKGYLKYKGSPVLRFSTGIRSRYGGQYFSFDSIPNSFTENEQNIVSGSVITLVGDQSGTGTPKEKRKPGLTKIFFPNFGLNYWYFVEGNGNAKDNRFKERLEKTNSILKAAEGFWIPSEICKKFVPSGW